MDSPLKLLIYGVAAATIIFIIYNIFIMPPTDTEKEIKKGIEFAHGNIGKLYSKEIYFKEGFSLKAQNMETPILNIRFECSNLETCSGQKIKIEPKTIIAKSTFSTMAHFRCKPLRLGATQIIDDCTAYFGDKPGNIEIQNVIMPNNPKQKETIKFSFELANNGKITAAKVNYEILFYFIREEGEEKKEILSQNILGEIKEINPNEKHAIARQIILPQAGNYIVKIIANSEDAGFAEWEKEIIVEQSTDTKCTATKKGKTILEEGMCKTYYECEGCEFGYECASKWKEKGIETENAEVYANNIKIISQPINGECKN